MLQHEHLLYVPGPRSSVGVAGQFSILAQELAQKNQEQRWRTYRRARISFHVGC